MEDSILTSVKKLLGITEEYEHFDPDILVHINSVFVILQQMGVGPSTGFSISDKTAQWSEYLDESDQCLNMVKSYMGAKVRMLFDPPQSGAVKEALTSNISELEWRLNQQAELMPEEEENTAN